MGLGGSGVLITTAPQITTDDNLLEITPRDSSMGRNGTAILTSDEHYHHKRGEPQIS